MSVFDKNGMLQRQEQMDIKAREQKILASGGSDNQKAQQIDMLYRERGLEPGSFYRAEFDQTAHLPQESGGIASIGSLWFQLKIIAAVFLFFMIWLPFSRHFPTAANYIYQTFITIWYDIGTLVFDWIPKGFNYILYKL